MAKIIPSREKQVDMVLLIQETFQNYRTMLVQRKNKMLDIYNAYEIYRWVKRADWETIFRVNKSWETANKITPRILSKNPKPLVSVRTDSYYFQNVIRNNPEKINELNTQSQAIQDYISSVFDNQNIYERMKVWAKNMVTYWLGFAKTGYKYETYWWDIVWECPTIEVKSWVDMYFDPRYKFQDDLSAVIEVKTKVRKADLDRNDEYFNLDMLDNIIWMSNNWRVDMDSYRNQIYALTWINPQQLTSGVDKDNLTLRIYYWFFNLTDNPENERLYEITQVEDLVIIWCRELDIMPFEIIKCFEDPETFLAAWFIEKILSLEQEINFKKNASAEYVNHSLNRTWFWSPQSWVNPNDLVSRPNGIIVATKGSELALKEVVEVPHRPLPQDYFMQGNELERDFQNQTFTVDTSNPKNQSALTNTATGARIKFFESNVVINEVRKNFEKGLESIAHKLLIETFNNMDKNLIIKKSDDSGYWDLNKEALKDAVQKYRIKIEANSSTFDSIEDRRDDAIAKLNIGMQLAQAGVPVDLEALWRNIFQSFEDTNPDRYFKQPDMMTWMMGQQPWLPGSPGTIQSPPNRPWPAEQLTEAVAKWWITTWL